MEEKIVCKQWEVSKRSKWVGQGQVIRSISMMKEEVVEQKNEEGTEFH